ncbi:MAG: hypothetical protein IPK83_18970 [Planctomycetes bacterium]|nr:hypothetical protein [Planctomycetota bacterium]
MSVRLITGRAGSGKTHWCQSRVCAELARNLIDGPRLIMLVPEQAALQMERGLLGMLDSFSVKALGRCEVLSFRRLANRILKDAAGPSPIPLTALGRQMALRLLISRHRKSLREFAKVAERGSFVREISRGIGELLQESVSPEQLDATVLVAEESADPTAARLHDAALLYRAYLEYLGDNRVDPEGVLDLARARLASAEWLRNAHIFVDGFAGLTRQQVRMLVELSSVASQLNIALIGDAENATNSSDGRTASMLSLFARTQQTWQALRRGFLDQGVTIEEPLHLDPSPPPRFSTTPQLAVLERNLFVTPPIVHVDDRFATDEASPVGKLAGLRIVRAVDRRGEVEAAVRCIVDFVQREANPLRYRDMAIIVRDLAPYHDILSASLHEHGIPFSSTVDGRPITILLFSWFAACFIFPAAGGWTMLWFGFSRAASQAFQLMSPIPLRTTCWPSISCPQHTGSVDGRGPCRIDECLDRANRKRSIESLAN